MQIVTIKVRCPDIPAAAARCQTDMRLALESVVSVALLEIFSEVAVDGIWVENEYHQCEESPDYPA